MANPERCSKCGRPIPADAPGGGCPTCLLEAGLGAEPDTVNIEPPRAEKPPFTHEELAGAFPHLEILELVGQGGMGVIYRARQRSLDRVVALKILPRHVAADPAFAERFNREARALAKLSHPNIVYVHESGKAGGLFYLIMEYVDGVNLRQAQKAGTLSPTQALAVVPQICDALQYAHDQGVVHRDIKPDNILLDRSGHVKIADFGLAKLLQPGADEATLTGDAQVMGTMHYMAPEQISKPKEVDHRADIFSLGVVFYEMLTGELPLGRFVPPSQKVEVDVRLDRVVLRTLEQERERRYQRADAVKTAVSEIGASPRRKPRPCDRFRHDERHGRNRRDGTRLSSMAVAGLLCYPAAAIVGLLAVAFGAGAEQAMTLAAAVAFAGVVLCGLAWYSIRSDPHNLRGQKLAAAGVLLPVALTVLGFGLSFTWFLVNRLSGGPMDQVWADMNAHEIGYEVQTLLFDIPQNDWTPDRERISHLVDPNRRHWLLSLGDADFAELRGREALGIALVDPATLAAPIYQYEFTDWTFQDGETYVTMVHGLESLTFPIVQVSGNWYLGVGKVKRKGAGP